MIFPLTALPRWTDARLSLPGSGTYRTLWDALGTTGLNRQLNSLLTYKNFRQFQSLGLPRLAWTASLSLTDTSLNLVATVTSGSGSLITTPRGAASHSDFLLSFDPVYYVDASGQLLLRNLSPQESATTSFATPLRLIDGDSYRNRGLGIELLPLLPGNPLTSFAGVSQDGSFHYQLSEPASGFLSLDGGPPVPLSKTTLPNNWDEAGSLIGLSRFLLENNNSYQSRQQANYLGRGNVRTRSFLSGIAPALGIVTGVYWDSSPISVPTGALPILNNSLTIINETVPLLTSGYTQVAASNYALRFNPAGAVEITTGGNTFLWPAQGNRLTGLNFTGSGNVTFRYALPAPTAASGASGLVFSYRSYANPGSTNPLLFIDNRARAYGLGKAPLSPEGLITLALSQTIAQEKKDLACCFGEVRWGQSLWPSENNHQSFAPGWDL